MVAQIQWMKVSVSLSKAELISPSLCVSVCVCESVCVCVVSQRVVQLADGLAVCFHSRHIGAVF